MGHPTLELKKAYLALRRALERTVKPFGLTGAQFDVLQLLMHGDDVEHRELQRQLTIASPTLTNILNVLEKQGHVHRRYESEDGRVKRIAMTDEARAVVFSKPFCEAGDELVELMFDGFSRTERTEFLKLLKRLERNLEKIV